MRCKLDTVQLMDLHICNFPIFGQLKVFLYEPALVSPVSTTHNDTNVHIRFLLWREDLTDQKQTELNQ